METMIHTGVQVTCIAPLYTHDYLRSLGASILLDDESQTVKDLLKSDIRYEEEQFLTQYWWACLGKKIMEH